MHAHNSALDTMKSEHRRIEAVLGALEAYAQNLPTNDSQRRGDLRLFVRFLKEYADVQHHAKEEDILFAAMLEVGFPRNAGPLPVMLHEHETGRSLVAALDECAGEAAWTGETCLRVRTTAMEFSLLLFGHIQKEDMVLYDMARLRLTPELMERVDEACHARDVAGAVYSAELVALADDLIARYPVRVAGVASERV